jgi:hypothetical protein
MIKPRRMKGAAHVESVEEKNAYRIMVRSKEERDH